MPDFLSLDAWPRWVEANAWLLLLSAAGLFVLFAVRRQRARRRAPDREVQSLGHRHRDVWLEDRDSLATAGRAATAEPESLETEAIPNALHQPGADDAAPDGWQPADIRRVPESTHPPTVADLEKSSGIEHSALVVVGPAGDAHQLPIQWGIVSIGNGVGATVCLDDPGLEPVHLLVSRDQNGLRITTFEAGTPITRLLAPNELVRFGGSTLHIAAHEGPLPSEESRAPGLLRRMMGGAKEAA